MSTTQPQPTTFLTLPAELRHQILLHTISNFDKTPQQSLQWPSLTYKLVPLDIWIQRGGNLEDLANQLVDVSITRRLAFHICKHNLSMVHVDIDDDVVYAMERAFPQVLERDAKAFKERSDRWYRLACKRQRTHGMRRCPSPADLITRITYRQVGSILSRNLFELPRAEMEAVVEKKGIPGLIGDVLVSLGVAAMPLGRGEAFTIERFNKLWALQLDCEDRLSVSGTQVDRVNAAIDKATSAKGAATDTATNTGELDRRYASYSGSHYV
ncbi:hypothetical protein EG328_010632 [Venturia inaequalis]|uniref:Uncharacterized protein n=1 Tax=Venturia inaequalis TaxID=5025 RepID=A0A8H3V7W3_VENIN|nr:hypothetical protein EG328_010632 [Venturia inaequalis]